MASVSRLVLWTAFLVLAGLRPGVDALERRLVTLCWNIPSEWNAIADVAIKSGAVDSTLDGLAAPWRQASVLPLGERRIAAVTVSDLKRSRVVFLTEGYETLGAFERTTTTPALVTDETRGYKPLTHIWPLSEQDGRILTLVSMAPLLSEPPSMGVFAYLAVGPHDTELLFVCELRWAPGPAHGELARADLNGDGFGDLVLYRDGRRDATPIAVLLWDPAGRQYITTPGDDVRLFMSWWSTTPEHRTIVNAGVSIDDAVKVIAKGL